MVAEVEPAVVEPTVVLQVMEDQETMVVLAVSQDQTQPLEVLKTTDRA
jgi:hypothetical protein